jgi:glyoxylase-like metal-dependent hydrolase (beta-lactamase superfamily II)
VARLADGRVASVSKLRARRDAGPRPIVVDPGSLTDADQLPELLAGAGAAFDDAATVVCSHYHSDHVGAVGVMQAAGAGSPRTLGTPR